jgi:two-component system chemotaxis sensor kinase CheA
VRLNVDLLDRMMSGMSDMVLARNELARALREEAVDPRMEAALERLSATVAEMRDTVTRTRMQKIESLFSALPRMVRDTAAAVGKAVLLQVEGSDVELDREMVEMMRDPLVHIIRNAIDHGIEPAADRRRAGKRETGRLLVSARQSGNQIIIEIADDGRGIDTARLVAKLASSGAVPEVELRGLSERARLDLIFHPGLSSKDEVTAISGRGVGMDVVRANVEQIGGRIELANTPGRGLTVSIYVPLTLSIISTVIVGVGDQRFAVPRQAVEEIVTLRGDAIRLDLVGDATIATVRDRRMPLVDLARVLGLGECDAPMLVILASRDGTYALAVDAVFDTEELVVKPAAPAVMAAGVFAGHTLPDSGRPMLLLDAAGIAVAAGLGFERRAAVEEVAAEVGEAGQDALLFVDLDGRRRAVVLAVVDRVETVPADAVRHSAGRLRMTIDGRAVPLVAQGALASRAEHPVLRLHDGVSDLGYAIGEALDIVALPPAVIAAASPGPISGVVVLDGEQIELIDPLWLFAEAAANAPASAAPLCLLRPDATGWLRHFLKPALEAAGYRVAMQLAPGEAADVTLALDGADDAPGGQSLATSPVVILAREPVSPGDPRIYRYNRAGVLAALADRIGRAA